MTESGKVRETARIIRQDPIADGVFSMWIRTEGAQYAVPGQFVSLYTPDKRKILPRPISIAEVNRGANALRLVYRVMGAGTEEFSHLHSDQMLEILAPLGNG